MERCTVFWSFFVGTLCACRLRALGCAVLPFWLAVLFCYCLFCCFAVLFFAGFWIMSLQQYVQLHESRHSSLRDSFFFWLASNLQLPVWECCTWHASFVLVEEPFLLSGLCGCVASGRGACWAQDAPQLLALLKGWQAWKHVRGRATVCVFALRVGAGSQK